MICATCDKPLPPLAAEHGDPYCSSLCCRRALGVRFDCDEHRSHTTPGRVRMPSNVQREKERLRGQKRRKDPAYRRAEAERQRERARRRREAQRT